MREFIERLKKHLADKKEAYVIEHDWCGDTEHGFHTETEIDMDKLMAEIDEFAASFQPAAPEVQP